MTDEFHSNNWCDNPRFETGEPSSSQEQKTTLDPGDMNMIGYGFQTPAIEWDYSFAGVHQLIDQRPQFLSHGNLPGEPPGSCNVPDEASFYSEHKFRPFLPPSWDIKAPPFQIPNNTAFWNASTSSWLNPNAPPSKFVEQTMNTPSSSSLTRSGNETSVKRSRSEASSPSPPFKPRKEKMGDRITTLQQLVSPFGKTDTASVLSEAIEYIKFLHEQITVLITPPFHRHQHSDKDFEETKDLQSVGLCLVSVPSTNDPSVDFCSTTFK